MKFTDVSAKNIHGMAAALRKGMKKVKPIRGSYLVEKRGDYHYPESLEKACYACAVGTAIIGAKISLGGILPAYVDDFRDLLDKAFPDGQMFCKICGGGDDSYTPAKYMEHLFEVHEWTRARIATHFEKEALRREKEVRRNEVHIS